MANKRDEYIERAFHLFESRGPATAYAYMQRVGFEQFPPTFLYTVQQALRMARVGRGAVAAYNVQLHRAHA